MCNKNVTSYHNIYDMIKVSFLVLWVSISLQVFSQNTLQQKTIKAFADAYNYQFNYGEGLFKVTAMEAARKIGIFQVSDMNEAVQQLKINTKYRNSLLQVFGSYCGYDYRRICTTLKGIGIDEKDSGILALYIISLSELKFDKELSTTQEVKANDKVEESKSKEYKAVSISKHPSASPENLSSSNKVTYEQLKNIYSLNQLQNLYGKSNLKIKDRYDEEGTVIGNEYEVYSRGIILFKISFNKDTSNIITFIKKQPQFQTPYGLQVGMPINKLVNLNQKDFKIYGFEWDYSGHVSDWRNGNLDNCNCMVEFGVKLMSNYTLYQKYMGDKEYYASTKDFTILKVEVIEISFYNKSH